MKKSIARFVSILLILSFLPTFAFADDWFLEKGDITVSATESGQTVSQGDKIDVPDAAPVIKNRDPSTSTSNTVTIKADAGQNANVTIEDTNINAPSDKAGIQTTGDGNVNLNIEGSNTVTGGDRHAGVEKNNAGNLTVGSESGTGKLEANGGKHSAGIGGGDYGSGSNITVTGGEINANGGKSGAGIGSGYLGACDTVTISGGTVTANGGSGGAGIGGGAFSGGTNISITGGQVSAKAGVSAAGIGGGIQETGSNITVSGDAQVKVSGGSESFGDWAGAAIGNGGNPRQEGTEITPDTSGLYTTGKIEYYEHGSDFEKGLKKTITGTVESPKTATASVSTPVAETVMGVLYRVTNLGGKDISYGAQRAEGMLTVTASLEDAILTGSLSGLKTLKEQNVTAITFVTESGSVVFLLDDILSQGALSDRYALTLSGGTVTFTLAGSDISGILK